LGRQGQREINCGAGLNGGINIKADSARADVTGLRGVLLLMFVITDAYGQAQREPPSGTLVIFLVWLCLGHCTAPRSKVSEFHNFKTSPKSIVSMSISDQPVKRRPWSYNESVVFVLDNYDSFTYNLVQYLGELGAEVEVRRNDEVTVAEIEAMRPERIVVSPGPCTPQEAGISIELISISRARARTTKTCRCSASALDTRQSARPSAGRWCALRILCTARRARLSTTARLSFAACVR